MVGALFHGVISPRPFICFCKNWHPVLDLDRVEVMGFFFLPNSEATGECIRHDRSKRFARFRRTISLMVSDALLDGDHDTVLDSDASHLSIPEAMASENKSTATHRKLAD